MNLKEFIIQNPAYREILERAVKCEEENSQNKNYLGWEWDDVRAYPAKLVKLVVEGIATIPYKSNKSTCYLLTDIDAVKKALL